jgi:dihydrolipoamide dehydrogenase
VLGAGPGGYSAAFRAADLGLKVVLVERYATLGGVCLNVGCIPSKALLHVAAVMDEVSTSPTRRRPSARRRSTSTSCARTRTRSSASSPAAWRRWPRCARSPSCAATAPSSTRNHVEVEETTGDGQDKTGGKKTVKFAKCIIAAGSQAVRLPFLPDDPRIVDSTGALNCAKSAESMLVIGGGIIGLEMGTVYSTLGARLDVVEMLDGLMQGADRDLVKVWQKMNAKRFDNIMLKTKTVGAEATADGIRVTFEGGRRKTEGAAAVRPGAAGRGPQPNGKKIGADKAGVAVTSAASSRSTRRCAPTCRTSSPSATSSASRCWRTRRCTRRTWRPRSPPGTRAAFDARVIPSVAYTDPEVAWVGLTEDEAKARASRSRRACSRGRPRAARSPTAATRASPSCCSTRRRTASSAAASSARTPAT